MSSLTAEFKKVTLAQKEGNYCGGGEGKHWCKKDPKYRWKGGYYYCKQHHKEEIEDLESESESENSESESESDEYSSESESESSESSSSESEEE